MARYNVVLVDGRSAALSHGCFDALVNLLVALGRPGSGFVDATPVIITRLRRALDRAVPGCGRRLIPPGTGGQFLLKVERGELQSRLTLDPTFFELVAIGRVSGEQADTLKSLCRPTAKSALKSKRNLEES
jgi:hypothetical protein